MAPCAQANTLSAEAWGACQARRLLAGPNGLDVDWQSVRLCTVTAGVGKTELHIGYGAGTAVFSVRSLNGGQSCQLSQPSALNKKRALYVSANHGNVKFVCFILYVPHQLFQIRIKWCSFILLSDQEVKPRPDGSQVRNQCLRLLNFNFNEM